MLWTKLTTTWWGITLIILAGCAIWIGLSAVFFRPFFKRFYDIVCSFLVLTVFSPIYLALIILVRIKIGKPVFFTQERTGRGGKIFVIHKFRTMTDERDEFGALLPDEKRLTKFGKFLRDTSLDELPEIWDIFRGAMSIVGPRPQVPEDMAYYTEYEKNRFLVKGGLIPTNVTLGKTVPSWDVQLGMDAEYGISYNFWLDIKIFFSVFKNLVIRAKQNYGAYVRPELSDERRSNAIAATKTEKEEQ